LHNYYQRFTQKVQKNNEIFEKNDTDYEKKHK